MFFSEYVYRPHVAGIFRYRKQTLRFSNTLSRVETFENGNLSYLCGWAKTEVFKYDDVMPRFWARSSAHGDSKNADLFKYYDGREGSLPNTSL